MHVQASRQAFLTVLDVTLRGSLLALLAVVERERAAGREVSVTPLPIFSAATRATSFILAHFLSVLQVRARRQPYVCAQMQLLEVVPLCACATLRSGNATTLWSATVGTSPFLSCACDCIAALYYPFQGKEHGGSYLLDR